MNNEEGLGSTPVLPKKKNSFGPHGVIIAALVIVVIAGALVAYGAVKKKNNSQVAQESAQPSSAPSFIPADDYEQSKNQGGLLPANTCPDRVFEENGQKRADYQGMPYGLTDALLQWVAASCSGKTGGIQAGTAPVVTENEPPLKLKSVGFAFGMYEKSTLRAGDMKFTKIALPFNQIFSPFGQQDPRTTDTSKRNPQPTFILPLGTKVRSLVDGEVVEVKELYSGDTTIWVAKDKNSQWFYETEHVKNPLVKVGDKVTAGQVIADVSDYDSHNNPGFGLVEIGILHPVGTGEPEHVCPFQYLDSSVKDTINAQLTALMSGWEAYLGKDVYKQEGFVAPGCVVEDPVKG